PPVLRLYPCQGLFPVHPCLAVFLGPHQACGAVANGFVIIGLKIVNAVARVAPNALDVEPRRHAAGLYQVVPLDPTVGEVDSEKLATSSGLIDVQSARSVLGVDDALP